MRRKNYLVYGLCFAVVGGIWMTHVVQGKNLYSSEMVMAQEALKMAFAKMELPKGDPNLLVLTNGGYGQIGRQSTEPFLDIAQTVTGASLGTRSLLPVHSSVNTPLWCSLFRKDTGRLIFLKWEGQQFVQQEVEASPEKILTPEAWKAAAAGPIGPFLFSVVSISLTWTVEPPWPLVLAATYHDHFCPGVNSGYIVAEYCHEKLPLRAGDQYIFVAAPGKCAADALQVIFNTTPGKTSGYAMDIAPAALAKYEQNKVLPMVVAMRVNRKADTCEGAVIGFDWNKAYRDTGVKAEEMAPPGGARDPMFWIARVKMSRELARLSKTSLLGYLAEMKRFSGKTRLAEQVAAGDPYGVLWNQ